MKSIDNNKAFQYYSNLTGNLINQLIKKSLLVVIVFFSISFVSAAEKSAEDLAVEKYLSQKSKPEDFSTTSAPLKQDLGGNWVGIFESYPHLVRVSFEIPKGSLEQGDSVDVELRLEPLVEQRSITRSPMGVIKAAIKFDQTTHVFSLKLANDSNRILSNNIKIFTGVLDEEKQLIAGMLEGSRENSPYFIFGKTDNADANFLSSLKDSMSPKRTPTLFGRTLSFGGGVSDQKLKEWASRFTNEYPKLDSVNTTFATLIPKATNLFRDEYFKSFFGKSYDELSPRDLQGIYSQISKLPFPRSNFPEEMPNGTLVSIKNAFLYVDSTRSVAEFRLSIIAMRAMSAWRSQSLNKFKNYNPTSENWAAIADFESSENKMLASFWPSERKEFISLTASARARIAPPLLVIQTDKILNASSTYKDIENLSNQLSLLNRPSTKMTKEASLDSLASLVPESEIQTSIKRLDNKWTLLATNEVQSEISSATGYDSYIKLLKTQDFLNNQLNIFNKSGATKPFFASLQNKIHDLGTSLAAIEKKNYDAFKNQSSNGIATLAEAKSREDVLMKAFGKQLASSEFSAFNVERKIYREKLITQNIQPLSDKIKAAKKTTEIDALIENYIVKSDEDSIVAKPILLAAQQRKSIIAPFTNLAGGDYLNAIYSGDAKSIKAADRVVLGAYLDFMRQSLGSAGLPGLGSYFNEDNFSLATPVLANYLFNYQNTSKKCLRPDAVAFTVTGRTADYVTTNGWGMEISRIYGSTYVDRYSVNKEFSKAFYDLGTSEPSSVILPDIFFNKGKSTAVLVGVESMMNKFSCDDPRIKLFEKNLLSYYESIRFH